MVGNHTLKFGVNFRKNRVTDFSYTSNQIGTYNFQSLTDFVTGDLVNGSYYSQKFSPLQDAHIRLYNIGVYAQDEWNVKPNLKVTYGIRLDRTANPQCLDDCFSRLVQPFDSSSFQTGVTIPYNASIQTGLSHAYYKVQPVVADPRVGAVFTVPGHPGTVVRSGFGIFSDLFPAFIVSNIFNNPPNPYNAFVTNGTVGLSSVPGSSAAIAAAQYAAFSSGFKNGATFDQLNSSIPGGFSPLNAYSIPNNFKTPEYLEWSFEVQQRISQKNVLTLTYSGNHGYQLLTTSAFANVQLPGGLLANISPVDPRFGTIAQYANDGRSNYQGLTVAFRRTLAYGFQGQVGYTWSHALDTISNGGAGEPYNFCSGCSFGTTPFPNATAGYGNADYDIRHNLVGDFLWDTPWKMNNKIIGNILGNWTLTGRVIARTGTPFSVYDGALPYDVSPTLLEGFNSLTLTATSLTSSLPITCGRGAVDIPCFSATQFAPSGMEATLGNLGRNAFTGPKYVDFDLSLFKNFNVTERMRFQFGASAYNVLNHPNFQNPVADVSNPGFGTIQSTAIPPTSAYGSFQGSAVSGRVLVLTGKFMF
ncbi:MAG TPA: hypothetical protein VH302_05430 [Bryobacteraceae bacterium]|nr:hypothetical protein [Bryobacteraceae bacterium]